MSNLTGAPLVGDRSDVIVGSGEALARRRNSGDLPVNVWLRRRKSIGASGLGLLDLCTKVLVPEQLEAGSESTATAREGGL